MQRSNPKNKERLLMACIVLFFIVVIILTAMTIGYGLL